MASVSELHGELSALRTAAPSVPFKTILAVGELGGREAVYAAAATAAAAGCLPSPQSLHGARGVGSGADWVKTSTGKEAVNANLPDSFAMLTAVKRFREATGVKVSMPSQSRIGEAKSGRCPGGLQGGGRHQDGARRPRLRRPRQGLLPPPPLPLPFTRGTMQNVLGEEWLTPDLFRIGASSLLDEVLKALQ